MGIFLFNFNIITVVLNVSDEKAAPSLNVTSEISHSTFKSSNFPLKQFDLRSMGRISKK